MSSKTVIAWTDHTFNPWWGCVKVDPGCAHCYAETFAARRLGLDIWGPGSERRGFGEKHWREPLLWQAQSQRCMRECGPGVVVPEREMKLKSARGWGWPHLVFSGSMCDWAEDHPTAAAIRPRLWDLIRRTPFLDWQLLTKRADRIARCLPAAWGGGWPNVWLGEGIHWVIFGGESGPGYRAPIGWRDWARATRDLCRLNRSAFFFKQSPAPRTELGTALDGETIRQFPGNTVWTAK